MTLKERKANFAKACRSVGEHQGSRCAARRANDTMSDKALVIAGAIGTTLLVHLRELSFSQALGPNDIQAAIDGFLEHAEIEEAETEMGGNYFQRKTEEQA